MRLRGVVMLGALVVGASACGDSVAPAAHAAADLEFAAPAVKGPMPQAPSYRTWDDPVTEADIARLRGEVKAKGIDMASLEEGGDEVLLPWILSPYVLGEVMDRALRVQSGFWGFGTGYTTSARIRVLDETGRVIMQETGLERSEDAPMYWYMRPHVEQTFILPVSCGAEAWTRTNIEVRVALPGFPDMPVSRAQDTREVVTYQQRCTIPGGGPGSGSGTTYTVNTGLYICYWEVWTDLDGNIVDAFLLGCTPISGYNQS